MHVVKHSERGNTLITRDEIRSIPEIHKSIQSDKERLRVLREKAVSLPTLSEQEKVQTSPSGSGNKYVEAAVDLNKQIEAKEIALILLQDRARAWIYSLPIDTEKQKLTFRVLKYRYLRCYTWEEIAELMVYTVRYLQYIEENAVKDIVTVRATSGI